VNIWILILIPLIIPQIFVIFDLTINQKNIFLLQTILLTIVSSLFAYYLSDKLILNFKDRLQEKGLFGRDLNKFGE
jgi:hypothetical protein